MTQREVAPELKQRFSQWIDERTAIGVQRYGEPLLTNNGRDARVDAFEELLDFTQYLMQHVMELEDELRIAKAHEQAMCDLYNPLQQERDQLAAENLRLRNGWDLDQFA